MSDRNIEKFFTAEDLTFWMLPNKQADYMNALLREWVNAQPGVFGRPYGAWTSQPNTGDTHTARLIAVKEIGA